MPAAPVGLSHVAPLGSLKDLVLVDASTPVAVSNVATVTPSATMVMLPVPASVTVTLLFNCDMEFVETVPKVKLPAPSVFMNCPLVPSLVGYLMPEELNAPDMFTPSLI